MVFRMMIMFAILLAIDIYAFQAVRTLTQNWSSMARNITYGIYWFIPIFALGVGIAALSTDYNNWNKTFLVVSRAFLMIAYVSKLPMAGVLLLDDLRRGVMYLYANVAGEASYDYSRSKFLSTVAVLVGTLPLATLTYGIVRNRYRYKVFREKVAIKNLPKGLEGLKIVQISDIHSGSFDQVAPVKAAVDLINKEAADLVFFTGDLVNSKADEMDDFIDIFSEVKGKHGVYSIIGNHDYGKYHRWENKEAEDANTQKLYNTHAKMGWNLLLNENRILNINGDDLAVIGVENWSEASHFPSTGDLDKAYAGTENVATKLLLSHDPSHWTKEVIERFKDIAITFSGHTHGMQFGIEIPGWLRWSPVKYVYKNWAGLYQNEDQYLYVNRGLGFLGYPGRVGILPEVTVIELTTA